MNVTSKGLRDLFFLVVGTAILYKQFWEQTDPSPLGVFVALFLYGLIPAFRADEGSVPGPLTVLARLMDLREAHRVPPGDRDSLAEQEARAERAAQVAKDRAAVRAALAEREGREDRPSRSSPPGSSEPDSR